MVYTIKREFEHEIHKDSLHSEERLLTKKKLYPRITGENSHTLKFCACVGHDVKIGRNSALILVLDVLLGYTRPRQHPVAQGGYLTVVLRVREG